MLEKPHPSTQSYGHMLIQYLRPQRLKVIVLGVLLLGSIGLQVINPQILRFFIDTALSDSEQGNLINAALLFIGIVLLTQIVNAPATYLFVFRILGNGLLMAGILIVLVNEDWRIGLAISVYSILVLAILTSTRNFAFLIYMKPKRLWLM